MGNAKGVKGRITEEFKDMPSQGDASESIEVTERMGRVEVRGRCRY